MTRIIKKIFDYFSPKEDIRKFVRLIGKDLEENHKSWKYDSPTEGAYALFSPTSFKKKNIQINVDNFKGDNNAHLYLQDPLNHVKLNKRETIYLAMICKKIIHAKYKEIAKEAEDIITKVALNLNVKEDKNNV